MSKESGRVRGQKNEPISQFGDFRSNCIILNVLDNKLHYTIGEYILYGEPHFTGGQWHWPTSKTIFQNLSQNMTYYKILEGVSCVYIPET